MKRFLSVAIVLLACFPVGVSLVGCSDNVSHFCDATDSKRTSEVATITLQPTTSSISLAYQQTRLTNTPSATNCLGTSVSVPKYSYTSSNPSILDVSTNGNLCSGTWNRNTGGGIPDFTICSPPSVQTIEALLKAGNNTYSQFFAQIRASANGVTSNAVTVYSHPQVDSAFGYTIPGGVGSAAGACTNPSKIDCSGVAQSPGSSPPQCYSQHANTPVTYCAVVCAEALQQNPDGTYSNGLADITPAAGEILFAPADTTVATISTDGVAQPKFPGATLITASVSGVTASAGIFSTCAPSTMTLTVPTAPTSQSVVVNINRTQQTTLLATDSTNQPVNLNGLIYSSTSPQTLAISSSGSIAPTFGGDGDVYAACLPPVCNPSPINDIGLFATAAIPGTMAGSGGNGVALTSNPINVITPGAETNLAFLANFDTVDYPNAKNFGVFNSTNNTVTVVPTPYRPNSMVLTQDGSRLYIGSDIGLMTYSALNSISLATTPDLNVPGRVLAVSPDGSLLIIAGFSNNDPVHGSPLIYLYTPGNGGFITYNGTAYRARWSADSSTAYIAGGDQEYVYSRFTGFSQYPTAAGATNVKDVAVLQPDVGAYFAGSDTAARTYCPDTSVTPPIYNPAPAASMSGVATDRLGLSPDGYHLFGAASTGAFNDLCVAIPTATTNGTPGTTTTATCSPANVAPIAACSPAFAVTTMDTASTAAIPAGFNVTGVPVANNTATATTTTAYTAFVTYTNCTNLDSVTETCTATPAGTGALPYYLVTAGTPGTPGTLTLTDPGAPIQPIAPTAGVISPDNTTAYIATSGDDALHTVAISSSGVPTENVAAVPPVRIGLPANGTNDGNFVQIDKIVIRPLRSY